MLRERLAVRAASPVLHEEVNRWGGGLQCPCSSDAPRATSLERSGDVCLHLLPGCRQRDSNPHPLRDAVLSRARLPITPCRRRGSKAVTLVQSAPLSRHLSTAGACIGGSSPHRHEEPRTARTVMQVPNTIGTGPTKAVKLVQTQENSRYGLARAPLTHREASVLHLNELRGILTAAS